MGNVYKSRDRRVRRPLDQLVRYSIVLLGALVLLTATASMAHAQTTVTATWDRNTDAYTVGYRVYYGIASGNYQWSVDAGDQVSVAVSLSPGSVYYFAVRAYNAQYEHGPASPEATIDLRTAAPTAQIAATLGSNNVATVTWQTTNAASATINGNTVALSGTTSVAVTAQTTFTLTAQASDGRTATASATVTPTVAPAPTAQITATLGANNLATVSWQTANAATASINGTAVALSGSSAVTIAATTTFTITATAADGRTATASATATVPSASAPGDPRNMTATVSGTRATLGWQPPATGGTPTHYLLYVGTRSGYSDVVSAYNVGSTLSVAGDLQRGTYYARVRAANNAGTSLNSNEVMFKIGKRLRSPTGFTVTWSGTTATLTWTASAADTSDDMPTNYVIEAGTAPGTSNVARLNVGNTTSFSTVVSSGNYYVRVIAQNALGESDPSNEIEVRAPGTPQAPTGLISASGTGPVDLRWTASSGGYGATGYVIEAGSAPGLSDLARLEVGNVTRFTTTAPPGVYYVRVRAINASGTSLPSNEVVVRR